MLIGELELAAQADGLGPALASEEVDGLGQVKHVEVVLLPSGCIGCQLVFLRDFMPVNDRGIDVLALIEEEGAGAHTELGTNVHHLRVWRSEERRVGKECRL